MHINNVLDGISLRTYTIPHCIETHPSIGRTIHKRTHHSMVSNQSYYPLCAYEQYIIQTTGSSIGILLSLEHAWKTRI